MTTHISCRECEFEALTDDTDEAVRMVDTHESTTGHRVEDECVDDGAKLVTDGGETVIACPECDSAEIRINNGGINTRTDQFADHVCEDCGTEFDADEAVEREPYHPGGMSEQTRQLLDADPDEIGKPMTDGGRDHSFPSDDLWSDYRDAEIGVGDVVVDLSRGVSLQVTSVATKHAGEHPDVRSDRTARCSTSTTTSSSSTACSCRTATTRSARRRRRTPTRRVGFCATQSKTPRRTSASSASG